MDQKKIENFYKTKIENNKKQINELNDKVFDLKEHNAILLQEWQELCEHDFYLEPNGDCHNPGYYKTCKKCEFFKRA